MRVLVLFFFFFLVMTVLKKFLIAPIAHKINITDSIRQGGVLSVIQYALNPNDG